jgi:YVTN family beta-propeller protein
VTAVAATLAIAGVVAPISRSTAAVPATSPRPLLSVPSFSSNVVSVFDLRTNRLVKSIGIQARGACCAYASPDRRTVYIVDGLSAYVTAIDTRSLKVTHVIPIQGTWGDHGSAMPSDGKMLWLDDLPQGDIEGIDTKLNKVTKFYGGVGGLFANSRDGRRLFIDSGSTFSVREAATGKVRAQISLPHNGSIAVQVSPDGNWAYVVGSAESSLPVASYTHSFVEVVDVHDSDRPRFVKSIRIGSFPLISSFTPDHRQLWVPNAGDGTISVIDLGTNRLVHTIRTGRYLTYVGFYRNKAYVMQSPNRIPPTYATSFAIAIPDVIPGAATAPKSGSTKYRPGIDPPGEIALYDRATYQPLKQPALSLPSEAFVAETVLVPPSR